jgi:hypothetical protein
VDELFFGGLVSSWLVLASVPLGLVVLGIVAVAGGRREEDVTGRRATAVYLGIVSFLALFAVLFAGTAAVGKVASLIVPAEDRAFDRDGGWFGYAEEEGVFFDDGDRRGRFDCSGADCDLYDPRVDDELLDEADDEAVRGAVWAGLIFLPAAAALVFHRRRRRDLVDDVDFPGSPAWRADRVFLYVVCAVAVVTAVIASAAAVYDVFRIIAPDITSDDFSRRSEREAGLADLITMTVLTLGAAAIFFSHWSQVSGEPNALRRLRLPRRRTDGDAEPVEAAG